MSEEEFPAAERRPRLEITFDDEPVPPAASGAAGAPPPPPSKGAADTPPPPVDATAAARPRFCSQCGAGLKAGLAFCEGCGASSAAAAEDVVTEVRAASPAATASKPPPVRRRRLIPTLPPVAPAATAPAAVGAVPWRGLRKPLLMVAGAVVAGVILLVVLQSVFGTTRGADSPKAAVQELIRATVSEDVAGIASILAPDETRGLGDLVSSTVGRARKARLLGEGRRTVAGVDITAPGIQLQDEKLSDSVHRVSIVGGLITVTTKASEANDIGREAGLTDTTRTLDTTKLRLMTVRQQGRWFVSPEHTVAEAIVTESDGQIGDFSQNPDEIASGAKTPEDAVKQFGTAALGNDLASLQRALTRPERGLMQTYSAAINEAYDDSELRQLSDGGQVNGGEFKTTDLGGGYKKVEINSLSGTFGGESVSFDGQCIRFSGESYCTSALNSADGFFFASGGDGRALPKVPVITGRPFVVVHKDKKGWAVSIPATAIEYARSFLRQHPQDTQIAQLVGELSWVPSKATVTAGAVATGKTDELWGNLRVNRGTAYGVAILAERKNQVLAIDGNGDSSPYSLSGDDEDDYPRYIVEVPGDDGAAGSFVVSTTAVNGTLNLKTFPVPSIKQRPPSSNAIEVTIPLTPKRPVVTLTGPTDVLFDVDDKSAAFVSCTGTCSFPLIVAAKVPGSAGPVKLKLSDLDATIDGKTSVDAYVGGSSASTFNVVVPSGKSATIDASPDGSDVDLVLEIDGDRTDEELSGQSESVTVSGPFDGALSVSSYDTDEGDSVSISVTTE